MSIYTSLNITRAKAEEIIDAHMRRISDDDLAELASFVLAKGNRFNVYRIVKDGEANDDDEL